MQLQPGGQVPQNVTSDILGFALLECVLYDNSFNLQNKTVSLSNCQRSYYWLPKDNETQSLVPGGSQNSSISTRDTKLITRAAVAAAALPGAATVLTSGLSAGDLQLQSQGGDGNQTASNLTWKRAIIGGTGAYQGVTGQEVVQIPVRFQLKSGHQALSLINGCVSSTGRLELNRVRAESRAVRGK